MRTGKKTCREDRTQSSTKQPLLLLVTILRRLLGLVRAVVVVVAVVGAGLVHLVEQVQARSLELVNLLLELSRGGSTLTSLALGDKLTERSNLLTDLVGLGLVDPVLELVESFLGVGQHRVGPVGGLDDGLALLIGLSILLSIMHHVLDLAVRETRARSNGDALVLVGSLVLGMDVYDAVSINVKRDLDLGDTTVGRGNANKLEVAKELVITDELTLTLVHLDLDSRLEVSGSGKHLRLLGGDGSVAVDQTGEDTAKGLDTEGEGSNVKEENVRDVTNKDSSLHGSANGNGLVRVDRLGRVTAKDRLDNLGDLGHTGHTTNENNLLDVLGLEASILESLANRLDSTLDKRVNEGLELSPSHLHVDVLRTGGIGGDEGKVDIGLEGRRKLNLGLLNGLTDTLDGHAVTADVDAVILLELLDDIADKGDVKVLTTKVSITVGRLDLKDTLLDLEDGDIKGTTTKIEDGNNPVSLLLKTIGESGGGGLVDDPENVQASDLTSVLGSLSLLIVEVGRDGDDGILNLLSEVSLGSLTHLPEDETTDLGGRVLLTLSLEPGIAVAVLDDLVGNLLDITLNLSVGELAADKTLGSEESVFWVDDGLTLGGNTDETLAILGEADNGGGGTGTLRVFDDLGDLALHHGNGRVGSSKIDTDDGALDLLIG